MNIKRVTRLLKLLQALQAGAGDNADGLAEASGVGRRTVFRDIEALKEAGVPVAFDHATKRYSLDGDYFLPPTNFTAEEALSIIGIATQFGRDETAPFYEPARRAAQKLEASLPADLRTQLQELTQAIHVRPPQHSKTDGENDFHQRLVDAQSTRRKVWLEYRSLTEWETIETVLRPYALMFNNRSWYVVGHSSVHKEVRTFHLGRIASLSLLDEKFSPPRGFSLEKHLGNAWRMIPGEGPDQQVHLRFEPMVARNVAEVRWHATQQTELQEDGSLDFRVTVSGLNEISWWILQYGDQVEVLEPTELRELIVNRINGMAKKYGNER